jgi:hypothetical protein
MWVSSRGVPGTASRGERAILWQGAKTFLHHLARFAAHVMIKIEVTLRVRLFAHRGVA